MEDILRVCGLVIKGIGFSWVPVQGPLISGGGYRVRVGTISFIGQDLTTGPGRNGKDVFEVIPDTGCGRVSRKRRTGRIAKETPGRTTPYRGGESLTFF